MADGGANEIVKTYVTVTRRAADQLEDDLAGGQTQVGLLSSLVEWYAAQPDTVRLHIRTGGDVAAELLRIRGAEMEAASGGKPLSHDAAMQLIRTCLDRIQQIETQRRREIAAAQKKPGR